MREMLRGVFAVTLLVVLVVYPGAQRAEGHLATWGSWEITRQNLDMLFPDSTKYLRKRYVFKEAEIEKIESFLGFALYPEDKTPEFYIALREEGSQERLLGVAIFIDPRVKPKVVGGEVVKLEVGIGVDTHGRVKTVRLYDYKGNSSLTRPAFLKQFKGRSLAHDFSVSATGGRGELGFLKVRPVPGEEEESQLIANAAREALYLMKVALGS